jgi:alanyl-tRNA synthetase
MKTIKGKWSGKEIRQSFIDFFKDKRDHTFVRSSSLVPGGDSTLLFTNAGMVQFKDIFLGIEKRSYSRAVNSQKCLRVAGKHNDLEEVGQDDTHHTFFEMLGNWSFGDYYKKEAIIWAWELLTEVWDIPKDRLYATVFEDEMGEIPTDEEAAMYWLQQPGFNPDHLFYMGRKDNFWEMADTGPCGPCSEIHIDLNPQGGVVAPDTLETNRFVELWNLVFIQYNRTSDNQLDPLPEKHVDTGMGFDRIVNILQEAGSNYRTDLLWPLIKTTQGITEQSEEEIDANFTPYRVIADHARAAAFLIADGVVPGNLGRNYITRMIIRRAFRFGGKLDIQEPFLARVALTVSDLYGEAYPELVKNEDVILRTITGEEKQFQKTIDKATIYLDAILDDLASEGKVILSGDLAAEMYTTYGMPFEITRDIVQEQGFKVDESGFLDAMEAHRKASGAGKAMGDIGGEDVEVYRQLREDLRNNRLIPKEGVITNPYLKPQELSLESEIIAILKDSSPAKMAEPGDEVEIIIPKTIFYLEAGGQVSDTGTIVSKECDIKREPVFKIRIMDVRKPAAGIISHVGEVLRGAPKLGDQVIVQVNRQRRMDIMRNHTATHLLHAALQKVLGTHARQSGSLVAPDRLRFDFNHPEALSQNEINNVEQFVNDQILSNFTLNISYKSIEQALEGGAIALFGEKYEDEVRNITIGGDMPFSNELCGGTHVENTGAIGIFIITSEGSVAAGIRRIEAVTGRKAYEIIQRERQIIREVSHIIDAGTDQLVSKAGGLIDNIKTLRNENDNLRETLLLIKFEKILAETIKINDLNLLTAKLPNADADSLRRMTDRFRQDYPDDGIIVLASVVNDRPLIIVAVTENLVSRGIKAGDLAGFVAMQLGGGGGGRPTIAQAGGKNVEKIGEALESVSEWVKDAIT